MLLARHLMDYITGEAEKVKLFFIYFIFGRQMKGQLEIAVGDFAL